MKCKQKQIKDNISKDTRES